MMPPDHPILLAHRRDEARADLILHGLACFVGVVALCLIECCT